MIERDYYMIPSDHSLTEVIQEFQIQQADVTRSWFDFKDLYGGTGTYHNNHRLFGLVFEGVEIPDGWYNKRGFHSLAYTPYASRKVSKEAYQKLAKLPTAATGMELNNKLSKAIDKVGSELGGFSKTSVSGGGFRVHYISYEVIGDHLILSVPESAGAVRGLSLLKKSEYFGLKELSDKDVA